MDRRKQRRLAGAGWRVGSAAGFLGLTAEEAALVEMKLRLSRALRARRTALNLSQVALAKRLGSSQSRVAKMEAADRTVSTDLLLRALLALGATPRDVANAVQRRGAGAAA
jgi:helix-turn-helix protein